MEIKIIKEKKHQKKDEWATENHKVIEYNWGEMGKLMAGKDKHSWIFGSFVKEIKSLAKTEDFELKYWKIKKSKNNKKLPHEPKFQVLATEYNLIIKGEIEGKIKDAEGYTKVKLKEGDYIVIKPGEIINLQEGIITHDVEGITIKTPSRHGDTIKKSFIEKLLNFEK